MLIGASQTEQLPQPAAAGALPAAGDVDGRAPNNGAVGEVAEVHVARLDVGALVAPNTEGDRQGGAERGDSGHYGCDDHGLPI